MRDEIHDYQRDRGGHDGENAAEGDDKVRWQPPEEARGPPADRDLKEENDGDEEAARGPVPEEIAVEEESDEQTDDDLLCGSSQDEPKTQPARPREEDEEDARRDDVPAKRRRMQEVRRQTRRMLGQLSIKSNNYEMKNKLEKLVMSLEYGNEDNIKQNMVVTDIFKELGQKEKRPRTRAISTTRCIRT